jgi:hypothetical protein
LRGFGLKVGKVSKGQGNFAARIRELAAGHPMLEPMAMERTSRPPSGLC